MKKISILLIIAFLIIEIAALGIFRGDAVSLPEGPPSSTEDSFEESTATTEKPTDPTEATSDDTTPVETTTPDEETDVIFDWNLLLVNPWNELPDNFSVELKQLSNGHAIDERAYADLQAMMDDARAQGLSPIICSSYRTQEFQQKLFDNKIKRLMDAGYSEEDAEIEAGKWVAVPGTSEHQTGLAVDIVARSYQVLDENQENTAEQQWLMENSYQYGFILRYPEGKTDITGINYEPWHYRYVGREAAKEIYEQGLCLEEYLDKKNYT